MESRPSRHCGLIMPQVTQMTRTGSMLAAGRPDRAVTTGRDGTVTLLDPQQPVSRLLDLLCVDDMISIRVTRDIQPGTNADGG